MERTRPGPALVHCAAILAAVAFCVLTAPADAAPRTHTVEAPAGWTVGTLPVPTGRTADPFGLQDKQRIGAALLSWQSPSAALTPWVSPATPGTGAAPFGSGGLLLDVPLGGGFIFTPSIGAGYMPNRLRPDGETVALRSQLEIGYAFDNNARVTLGYTHMRGGGDGRDGGETLGFTLRLPFGALTGD